MTENRVMKLWTAIVTAFLALCTALGFATPSATAATAQTGPTGPTQNGQSGPTQSDSESSAGEHTATTRSTTVQTTTQTRDWPHTRSLPPTMKQRISAEAHGKAPNCRHRPLGDTEPAAAEHTTATCAAPTDLAERTPSIPLQR